MLCTICKTNEVEGVDFCRICFYTGAAAERELKSLLSAIEALDEVVGAAVWHTGGGCFNLAVTLTDGRLLTPSEAYVNSQDGSVSVPGLPGWGDDPEGPRPVWAMVVSDSEEAWSEWDEARLWIPQQTWTTDQLVEGIAKVARNEIVRPAEDRDRALAQALRNAEAAGDEDATAYALNDIAARLDLDPDETEQGLTPKASAAIDEFVAKALSEGASA